MAQLEAIVTQRIIEVKQHGHGSVVVKIQDGKVVRVETMKSEQ